MLHVTHGHARNAHGQVHAQARKEMSDKRAGVNSVHMEEEERGERMQALHCKRGRSERAQAQGGIGDAGA